MLSGWFIGMFYEFRCLTSDGAAQLLASHWKLIYKHVVIKSSSATLHGLRWWRYANNLRSQHSSFDANFSAFVSHTPDAQQLLRRLFSENSQTKQEFCEGKLNGKLKGKSQLKSSQGLSPTENSFRGNKGRTFFIERILFLRDLSRAWVSILFSFISIAFTFPSLLHFVIASFSSSFSLCRRIKKVLLDNWRKKENKVVKRLSKRIHSD